MRSPIDALTNRLRAAAMRVRGLFGGARSDEAFARELESHLELHIDDHVRAGLSYAEARRRALLALGGIEQTREAYRDQRGIPMIETFVRDLRYGARGLRKSPAFTAAAVLILGIGIGACTAMFSLVNAVIFRPLPFTDPERLVWIENKEDGDAGLSGKTSRTDVLRGWRARSTSFVSIAAYNAFSDYNRQTLSGSGEPEQLRAFGVTDNFLPTLGIVPFLGRNFSAEEAIYNGPRVVILSYDYWQRRFASDPSIVGKTLTLNKKPTTVIGVLPRTFDFDATFTPGSQVDLLEVFPVSDETARFGNTVFGIARLKPGVTPAAAEAELAVINPSLKRSAEDVVGAQIRPIDDVLRGRFRGAFMTLAGAVLCVLGIACMNLSNLLLTRVNSRRQEFAVRMALGARRLHLIRQALTESLLLAFAGSLLGVPFAVWATSVLARMQTFGVPLLQDASVDPTALAVTIGLTTLAGIACGILPALYLSSGSQAPTLQNATQQRSAGRSSVLARNGLIVGNVALACVLLVGAGLLFRSFESLLQVNVGFEAQHAMAWRVDPGREFKNGAEVDQYLGELTRRVAALPGVEAVGLSDTLPLGRNRTWGAGATGETYTPDTYPVAFPRLIDAGYLKAMKIQIVAGHGFDERFDPKAPNGVLINETLARKLWPGRDPLGRQIDVNGKSTVIGVVADVRHASLEETGGNEMYLDCRQLGDWSALEMIVRSSRPPEALTADVRKALLGFDPTLPTREFYALERLIDDAVAPRRLISRLLGFFSALALILAAVGLYGVVAYSVAQRKQEIGVRMAIGATRPDVLRLVLRGGLSLVALGIAIGLVAGVALTGLLRSQLYGISAHDPLTFGAITALMLTVAFGACIAPALRATRIDPMVTLRAV